MPVFNKTRSTLLGGTLLTLNRHFKKTLGLLNGGGIPGDCVLWISPCHGIYTVGMKSPVDIAFLDSEWRIVKILKNFPPGCFADSAPSAVSAIELPADRLSESRTSVGDILELDLE